MNTTKNTATIGNATVRFTRWTFGPEVRAFRDADLAAMIRDAEERAMRAAMAAKAGA